MRLAVLEFGTWHPEIAGTWESFGVMLTRWVQLSLPQADLTLINIAGNASFPDPGSFDGYVVSGSEKGVYDTPSWMPDLRQFLTAAKDLDKPLFGVCFGHQIMADTFGGKAEQIGRPEVGLRHFKIGENEFSAHVWHQDQVTTCPKGAKVTVTADYCPIAGLAYPFKARSVQFHPEYPAAFILHFLNLKMEELLDLDLTEKAIAELEQSTVPEDLYSKELSDFFHQSLGD